MSGRLTIGVLSQVLYVPRDGLIGEWLLAGNAIDSSGNSHNGTVSGAVLGIGRKGFMNTCYNFLNTTDVIRIGNYCNIEGNYSISLWGKKLQGGNSSTFISKGSSPVAAGNFNLYWLPRYRLYYSPSLYYDSKLISLSYNTWYHYVITIDRTGNMNFYINNELVSSVDIAESSEVNMINNGVLVIGNNNIAGTRGIIGSISEVRIYNRSLSVQEVAALYNE